MAWRAAAARETVERLFTKGGGLLPRRGRGVAILFRFFAEGGRRLVLRVPLTTPRADGMRTAPVQLLLQPDGDVVLVLPKEALGGGLLDAGSVRRLRDQLESLQARTASANPLWGLDAAQLLSELAGAAAALTSAVTFLERDLSHWTTGVTVHGVGTAVLAALPAVMAKLRPWFVRTVLPHLLPLAMSVGETLASRRR